MQCIGFIQTLNHTRQLYSCGRHSVMVMMMVVVVVCVCVCVCVCDGQGVVVKFNANQRYATTAITASIVRQIASAVSVPLQVSSTSLDSRHQQIVLYSCTWYVVISVRGGQRV